MQVSHTWTTEIQKATKVDEGTSSAVTLRQLSELKKATWRLKRITEYPERWEDIDSDQDILSHHCKTPGTREVTRAGVPSPLGHGWQPVHGLLGTGPHGRRWEKQKPSPPSPVLEKNCLPWNQSLMPKRLGTTSLQASKHVVFKGLGIRMASELSRTSWDTRKPQGSYLHTPDGKEFPIRLVHPDKTSFKILG